MERSVERGQRIICSTEEAVEMEKQYEAKIAIRRIAASFGVGEAVVRRELVARGVTIRTNAGGRACELDHSAFDIADNSPSCLYWIGLMLTDGNIHYVRGEGGAASVQLQLKKSDVSHVALFRDFVRSTHAISFSRPRTAGSEGMAHFQFNSRQIADRMAEFGVQPRKTHSLKVLKCTDSRDLWRGVIDGDGCISFDERLHGQPVIELVSASKDFAEQFAGFVKRHIPHVYAQPTSFVNKTRTTMWRFRVSARYAAELARILYYAASPSLERKQEKAHQAMAWEPSRPEYRRRPELTAAVLQEAFAELHSWKAVGVRYEVSSSSLFQIRKRLGITTRRRRSTYPSLAHLESLYSQLGSWSAVATSINATYSGLMHKVSRLRKQRKRMA